MRSVSKYSQNSRFAAMAVACAAAVLGGCHLNKLPTLEEAGADAGVAVGTVTPDAGTAPVDVPPDEPIVNPEPTVNEPPELGVLAVSQPLEVGTPVTVTLELSDPDGIASCSVRIRGTDFPMTILDDTLVPAVQPTVGVAHMVYIPQFAGEISFRATCRDAAEDPATAVGNLVTLTVKPEPAPAPDTTLPVIEMIYPFNGTSDLRDPVNVAFRYIERNLDFCELATDGVWARVPVDGGLLYQASVTFTTTGAHTLAARCTDLSGNVGTGETRTVNVYSVSVLGAVNVRNGSAPATVTTAPVGTALTYRAIIEERSPVTSCSFLFDGAATGTPVIVQPTGTVNGTVSVTHSTAVPGAHTAQFSCVAAGVTQLSGTATVTITADVVAPTVGALSQLPADALLTVGGVYVFSAAAADDLLLGTCDLALGTAAPVAAPVVAGIASAAVTYNGEASAVLTCRDASGNVGSASIALAAAPVPDTVAPVVGALGVLPADAAAMTVGGSYAFSATASDDRPGVSCELTFTDGVTVSAPVAAPVAAGVASVTVTYGGEPTATLTCRDVAGNAASSSLALVVAAPPPPPPVTP